MFDKWRERRRKKREEEEHISEIIGADKHHDEYGQLGKDEDVLPDATITASRGGKLMPPL